MIDYRDFDSVGKYKDALAAQTPPRYLAIYICWKVGSFQRENNLTFPEAWKALVDAHAIIKVIYPEEDNSETTDLP